MATDNKFLGSPPREGQQDTRQLGVSQQNSVAAPIGYCLVTWMLLALVVTVNPAVWLVNDPLIEPAVRAV
jgi:hypothetical protein